MYLLLDSQQWANHQNGLIDPNKNNKTDGNLKLPHYCQVLPSNPTTHVGNTGNNIKFITSKMHPDQVKKMSADNILAGRMNLHQQHQQQHFQQQSQKKLVPPSYQQVRIFSITFNLCI